jgi:glycosyltransferase
MSGINRTTELIKEFGFSVTFAKLFQTCTRQILGVQDIAGKIKYAAITKFLYNENKDIIEKYNRESHESTSKIENGTVWVLWWQGIDKAPDIVKICIQSIRKNIGNRNLVILDESNFRDYTNLNPKYENLLNAGAISKTQFSDLLRLNLLYNRGGYGLTRRIF